MTVDIPIEAVHRAAAQGWHAVFYEKADFLFKRILPDGRLLALMPLFASGSRLGIGPADSVCFTETWDYPFELRDNAWRAALGWDGQGEPEGWYRHNGSGRRRPGGDPEKEHIR